MDVSEAAASIASIFPKSLFRGRGTMFHLFLRAATGLAVATAVSVVVVASATAAPGGTTLPDGSQVPDCNSDHSYSLALLDCEGQAGATLRMEVVAPLSSPITSVQFEYADRGTGLPSATAVEVDAEVTGWTYNQAAGGGDELTPATIYELPAPEALCVAGQDSRWGAFPMHADGTAEGEIGVYRIVNCQLASRPDLAGVGVDLNGTWIGQGYQCGSGPSEQTVEIAQSGASVTATKVVDDGCVKAGQVTWTGTASGNSFPAECQIGDGATERYITCMITVVNANTIIESGPSGDAFTVTFHRQTN